MATIGGGADARLEYALRQGGARVVTVRRSRLVATYDHLAHLTGAGIVDASAAFVEALRAVARDRGIEDFGVVLRADAPDASARDRSNLQVVVADAWKRLEATWTESDVLVLDGLTPFGRYDGGMAVLDRLLDAARRGAGVGPRVVMVLCATQDEQEPPRIGARAVGLETGEEWVVAPSSWAASITVA